MLAVVLLLDEHEHGRYDMNHRSGSRDDREEKSGIDYEDDDDVVVLDVVKALIYCKLLHQLEPSCQRVEAPQTVSRL